ncbi:MAG: SDR family oxidoreductase [Alphaproteobacteria bacterium]
MTDQIASMPRAALVTGAARRIGRAIALALARDGWAVAVHYRSGRDEAEALVAELAALGRTAVALTADLADETATTGLVALAQQRLGPLGLLVNNASMFEPDGALDHASAGWDAHMAANLRAPVVLTQQFARALPARAEGCAINILDQRVWNLTPHFFSYTISKAALWTATQTMALALAPRIRVNAIGPGPVLPSPRQSQAQFDAQCREQPLQRGATPEDIADAVLYLTRARAMTGQMLALDGGQHLNWAPGAGRTVADE